MKVTHIGLFNRAADSYDFATIWAIEDACAKDLEEAERAYKEARLNYKNATSEHDKNWANAKKAHAESVYLEKLAAYYDFYKGY